MPVKIQVAATFGDLGTGRNCETMPSLFLKQSHLTNWIWFWWMCCQGCVLFLPNDTWTHYITCWCQCWCCLSTVMVVRMLFSYPKQTYELGCTCGQVSMAVTMVCVIRAPRWCNDKRGSWLSLIFSSISIYCLYRHEHHHTVIVAARCNLTIHRAFPATRSAVIHLSGSVSAPFLSFPPL